MYANMLNVAVHALKAGQAIPDLTQPFSITAEINLRLPALLPDAYCPDVHERLTLYKRLANCNNAETLQGMQEELIDRYGELPEQAQCLIETHRLRLLGKPLGVAKLDAGSSSVQIQFVKNPPIEPLKIIQLIQTDRAFKLAGPDKLSWQKATATLKDRAAAIKDLFRRLGA
jgi:transcription-repair coupling factor (superfamily II helicase)